MAPPPGPMPRWPFVVGSPVLGRRSDPGADVTAPAPMSLRDRVGHERWKPIPGWPYEASSDGDIRNAKTGKVLQGYESSHGYLVVSLKDKPRCRPVVGVHRLVVEAWLGPIPDGMQVHLDGVKTNNGISNLEVTTAHENTRHAFAIGLSPVGDRHWTRRRPDMVQRGPAASAAVLTADDVVEVRHRLSLGETCASIARSFGVNRGTVSLIKRGRTHKPLLALEAPASREVG